MMLSQDETAQQFDDGMPFFCCDPEWNIVSFNNLMKNAFPQIATGMNVTIFSENNTAIFLNAKNRLGNGLPYFSTNFELLSQKTTIYFLPFVNHPAENDSGVYSCYLEFAENASIQDIYRITDSYRSPITDILNSSSILANRFEELEDYDGINYINHVVSHCYSMLKTTTTAQTYYKLLNNSQKFLFEKTDINDFVSSLHNTLGVLFLNSPYSINYSCCDESVVSDIDSDLLSLAIFHLISNACSFSPTNSAVNISLTKNSSVDYTISVTDTGDGIPPEYLHKIFEPFFSYHDSPVPEEKLGVGLGLNIVKLICDIHGGSIFVNSKKNNGTTFSIKMPIISHNDSSLTVQTNTAKYITNKFSNCYILFSDICNIKLY